MPVPEPARLCVPIGGDVQVSLIPHDAAPGTSPRTPVLLVHGLASNARMWDGVGDALARRGHRSIALDQRGHGRSDTPDAGYDFATLVADLVAVMDATGLDRPIVVGQSWGAHVVLELAVRQPGRVSGVVCVDGALGLLRDVYPDWSTAERALTPPELRGTPVTELEGWIRARHPDWPESGIAGALANFRVRDDDTVEPWLTRERHMTIARQLWEHDPVSLYPRLGVPGLLLVADPPEPDAARHQAIEAIAAASPGLRVTWFHPGDHDLHAQFPERVAQAISDLDPERA